MLKFEKQKTVETVNEIRPSDSPAVEHGDQTITYAHFCLACQRLAQRLTALQLNQATPVAIMMERGFGLYTSQFAVLSTGGFFLPIDPANPDERIKFLLSDSQAACVMVDSESAQKIKNLQLDLQVIEVEPEIAVEGIPEKEEIDPVFFPHASDDWAYMIYTSGSTGQPKGVCIHWEAVCNHNRWFIDAFALVPQDRCLQIASIGFDISIEEIFTTLRQGACLVTINKQSLDSPAKFLRWIGEKELTVLNIPTALWHNIVPALETEAVPDCVRLTVIGGEAVNSQLVEKWFKHVAPDRVRLVNGYGPTETTITAAVSELSPSNLSAIGLPINNLECHIIGDNGQLIQSPETPGELFISGVGVAKGYWNRPKQTDKAFLYSDLLDGKWCYCTGDKVQWGQNGQMYFLGRADNQIKLRGFRIELHEIENAIGKHPKITNAVVRKSESGHEQLVCFATSDKTVDTDVQHNSLQKELTDFLKQSLPHYMLPSQYLFLDEFPTTVGGKVDTKKLMSMSATGIQTATSTLQGLDQLQSVIAEVWQSVLGIPPVTLETTFEQSGGDSLSAMAMALGLEKAFPGKTFGVATLLAYPTVSQLAGYVSLDDFAVENNPLMPIVNSLGQPLDSKTPCLIFLHPGGGSGYLYNQLLDDSIKQTYSILILDSPWLTGKLPDLGHGETTLTIAERCADVLADRLPAGVQIVTAGYSFGGILAFETARYMEKRGFEINYVINIDQPIPEAIHAAGLPNRLLNWLRRLKNPKLTWRELAYCKEKDTLQAGGETNFSNPKEMMRSFDLEDLHASIEDSYKPQHVELKMHLIRGEVVEAKYVVDSDYGWEKYSRQLFIHRVTGTHSTIFMGRNLKRLRKMFQQLLNSSPS